MVLIGTPGPLYLFITPHRANSRRLAAAVFPLVSSVLSTFSERKCPLLTPLIGSHLQSPGICRHCSRFTMKMSLPTITEASWADVDEIAALYTEAFIDNGAYSWVFLNQPTEELKARAKCWLFNRRIVVMLRKRSPLYICRDDVGRIIGAAGIVARSESPTTLDMILAGLLLWPLRWGLSSMQRALSWHMPTVFSMPDGTEVRPGAEMSMVAVSPSVQSKGIGSALVRRALDHWDATHPPGGGAVALSTQKKDNIRFYNRLGFELVSEELLGEPDAKWPNYHMLRPPASTRSTPAPAAAASSS